ncbi:hypothetical protein DFS34DRAFT_660753 [Phlyctochytrium arcticum]|nr:hypothetical protein DFS34DRAFT_660753 [Phlyctochytrium arcticum]
MFRKLIANSPNITIKGEMMFSHSATARKVRGYQVRYIVAPSQPSTATATEPAKKKRKKNTKISKFINCNIPPEVIVTVSERLLPLTLWGDKKVVPLNVHTDISDFAAVERVRTPLQDITNQGDAATDNKKFFNKFSTFEKPPMRPGSIICQCPILSQDICIHLKQLIAGNEFIWWIHNMAKPLSDEDFVRDEDEDEEITEELW